MHFFPMRFIPFFLGLTIFLTDGMTKFLTEAYLPLMQSSSSWYPYGGIPMFKNFLGIEFSICHQINKGAAWGMLAAFQVPLLLLRIFLILFLIIYAYFYNKQTNLTLPFALIIAGATGNVVDYFLYGHVIDMLHFVLWGYDFPVFNLADSSIFLGISWMLIASTIKKTTPAYRN